MPYRAAVIGDLKMVDIDREGPIPAFIGQIEGQHLIVRFDVAALAALAGRVGAGDAVTEALRARAPAIKAAAQDLLAGGYWTETGDGIEILITALDL